jgi:hypothetical protein
LIIDTDKDWGGRLIKNLGAPAASSDAARLADLLLSKLAVDTNKDWGGHLIKNLGAPSDPADAARKADVDSVNSRVNTLKNNIVLFTATLDADKNFGATETDLLSLSVTAGVDSIAVALFRGLVSYTTTYDCTAVLRIYRGTTVIGYGGGGFSYSGKSMGLVAAEIETIPAGSYTYKVTGQNTATTASITVKAGAKLEVLLIPLAF